MPKQPDPDCPFCRGSGYIDASTQMRANYLPCVCTNERPDELPLGRERVV